MTTIDSFTGQYRFLSNFYPISSGTVEHLFQASKTYDLEWMDKILNAPTPGEAKRLGRKAPLREDWDEIKLIIMENLLLHKFSIPELRDKLLETGDAELAEGNWWGDTYWGKCNGLGHNHLGRLLMKIREANK